MEEWFKDKRERTERREMETWGMGEQARREILEGTTDEKGSKQRRDKGKELRKTEERGWKRGKN